MLLKHTWTEAKCTTFTSPCLRHDSHTKPPTQTTIKDVHILERHDVSGGNQSQPYTRTRTHTTTIYSKLYIHDVLCQQRHSAIPIGFCIITSIFPLQKKNYTSSFWQGKSKMKKKKGFKVKLCLEINTVRRRAFETLKKAASEVLVRLSMEIKLHCTRL